VTVVEWAEKVEAILPARALRVRIRGVGDEPREIEIEGLPPGWEAPAP
jgi:tRNA A37 threonylcarbamoyladenosine biosynthesis protein TsaE